MQSKLHSRLRSWSPEGVGLALVAMPRFPSRSGTSGSDGPTLHTSFRPRRMYSEEITRNTPKTRNSEGEVLGADDKPEVIVQ